MAIVAVVAVIGDVVDEANVETVGGLRQCGCHTALGYTHDITDDPEEYGQPYIPSQHPKGGPKE